MTILTASTTFDVPFVLHHVAFGASTQGAERVQRLVVHREDEDGQLRVLGEGQLDQLDAIRAGQGDIEQNSVWSEAAEGIERFRGGLGFAANLQVGHFIHQALQTVAENGMIIDDEEALRGD
jgi:hypothetical protein